MEEILYKDEQTGASTKYVRIVGDRGIPFEKAMEVYEKATAAGSSAESGFYKGRSGSDPPAQTSRPSAHGRSSGHAANDMRPSGPLQLVLALKAGARESRNDNFNGDPNIQLAIARKEQNYTQVRFFKIARANSGIFSSCGCLTDLRNNALLTVAAS